MCGYFMEYTFHDAVLHPVTFVMRDLSGRLVIDKSIAYYHKPLI